MLRLCTAASRRAPTGIPTFGRRRSLGTLGFLPSADPFALVQQGITTMHVHTGLPWWLAVAGSAVALRVALLPAAWYQLRELRRFIALRPQVCTQVSDGVRCARTCPDDYTVEAEGWGVNIRAWCVCVV